MGASRGLLLRGGDALERLAGVDTVVLDKTGTLTQGRPSVTAVVAWGGEGRGSRGSRRGRQLAEAEVQVLSLAAAVETAARHPMADAIIAAAREEGCQVAEIQGAMTVPGKGVVARVGGRQVAVGEMEWALRVCGSGDAGVRSDDVAFCPTDRWRAM